MEKERIFDKLHNDYGDIRTSWAQALAELQDKLFGLDEAQRQLTDVRTDLEVHRHTIIMAEMHEEGRINGSNAAKRKRQTEVLLADLPEIDPDYAALLTAADKLEAKVDTYKLDIDILRNRISALRNQARMVGGLAYALGG